MTDQANSRGRDGVAGGSAMSKTATSAEEIDYTHLTVTIPRGIVAYARGSYDQLEVIYEALGEWLIALSQVPC